MARPVVVDTTVLIDHLRGHRPAADWLRTLDEVPFSSEVVRVEVMQGMRPRERAATERFLDSLEWVAVGEAVTRRAGALGREYRRSHASIGVVDLVVAATALELGADLATHNVTHYPMFEGLAPPYDA